MSIICKMFTNAAAQDLDGTYRFELSAVCRGEENKLWAAATPVGSLASAKSPVLDELWAQRTGTVEVLVRVVEDAEGDFELSSCGFTYGGCEITLTRKVAPWGHMKLGINATAATLYLRKAYAESLLAGKPAKFRLEFEKP